MERNKSYQNQLIISIVKTIVNTDKINDMELTDEKLLTFYNKDVKITQKSKTDTGKIMGSRNESGVAEKVKVVFLWSNEKLVNIDAEEIIGIEQI